MTYSANVLLVNPPSGIIYSSPPLGLAYIASSLMSRGHEVKVLDLNLYKTPEKRLRKYLQSFSPDVVGVTVTTPTTSSAKRVLEITKEVDPSTTLVVGGSHITFKGKEFLENSVANIGVVGEGEETIIDIVENLHKRQKLKRIKGIWLKNKKVVFTGARNFIEDLDRLCFPSLYLLPIGYYRKPIGEPRKFISMISSRGCPFSCSFCSKPLGKICRFRSPKNLMEEIFFHLERIGERKIKEIVFYDDIFTFNKKRVIEFCKLLISSGLNIKWKCESRVDLVDKEMLIWMKKAGCYMIAYGIESGNQKILDYLKKGFSIKQIKDAVKITKKVGIKILGYFILGAPGEGIDEIKNTIKFAKLLNIDYAQFSILTPYPGSEIFSLLKKDEDFDEVIYFGRILDKKIVNCSNIPTHVLKRMYKKAFFSFYVRPRSLFREISDFLKTKAFEKLLYGTKILLTII
ncbi:MAG: cobalamin-dependent protein [Candidatus Aenigmarchaeota archaeon]|nr:cobalamin-dependent protein [Candidatus Aenigmarchaeota archaeon]